MQERARLGQLLSTHSVVTLAGSGGVGKTRLALEVAGDVLPHLADGVWLVELATANDLESAARACAFSLGVAEQPGRGLIDTLGEAVEDKSLLVILDNCEHLLETAGQLALRLVRGGHARVLATSWPTSSARRAGSLSSAGTQPRLTSTQPGASLRLSGVMMW